MRSRRRAAARTPPQFRGSGARLSGRVVSCLGSRCAQSAAEPRSTIVFVVVVVAIAAAEGAMFFFLLAMLGFWFCTYKLLSSGDCGLIS